MSRLRSKQPCWCGSGERFKRCHGDTRALSRPPVELGEVSAPREVPEAITRPDYVRVGQVTTGREFQIHTADTLERHRVAGRVAAEVLLTTGAAVAPGVTTDELDALAHETYLRLGAYPSTLHYNGFSKSICTSVNGVICHGIPDSRALRDGDIVNIDVTAYIDGMHGDTSAMFVAGQVTEPVQALIDTTREATLRGIAVCRPGAPLAAIADVIEPFVESRGFGVVEEYGGHGIGVTFHAAPHIHHARVRQADVVMEPGMTFTIEPMVTTGGSGWFEADDGWTVHTDDAFPSAQFEHTITVTDEGVEILTVTADGRTAVGTLDDLTPASS